jgi:hypothetical protein
MPLLSGLMVTKPGQLYPNQQALGFLGIATLKKGHSKRYFFTVHESA